MRTISVKLYKSKKKAKVEVETNNGMKETVYIEPCHGSYEQYGANTDVLWHTLPIAEQLVENNFETI